MQDKLPRFKGPDAVMEMVLLKDVLLEIIQI